MSESLKAYGERRFAWAALHRWRPSAGLAFEKHVWRFPRRAGAELGTGFFEHAAGIAIRDRHIELDGDRSVPRAVVAEAATTATLSRVALVGRETPALLASLHHGKSGAIYCEQYVSRFTSTAEVPPEPAGNWTHRVDSAEHVRRAYVALLADPSAYLLAAPPLPLTFQRVRLVHALHRFGLEFEVFVELVKESGWIATSLASARFPVDGIALFGGHTLIDEVTAAARSGALDVDWVDDPTSVARERITVAGLPSLAELPASVHSANTLDVAGYNIVELPSHCEATTLVLDETGVVELGPLARWPALAAISLRGIRPRSLDPVRGVRDLTLDYVEPERLQAVGDFENLERLRIENGSLDDLRILSRCSKLRALELSHVHLGSLRGLESLASLEELAVHVARVPAELAEVGSLHRLRRLSLHVAGEVDVAMLPVLRHLEELEVCGLEGRALAVCNAASLQRHSALHSLALRTTDLVELSWLSSLGRLRSLDLDTIDAVDLTPLGHLSRLRRLNINQLPSKDVQFLAHLPYLEAIDVSRVDADLSVLRHLVRLRELTIEQGAVGDLRQLEGLRQLRNLSLRGNPLQSLASLAQFPELESLDVAHTGVDNLDPIRDALGLRELWLSGTAVGNFAPLSRLTSLEELDLSSTRIADTSLLSACEALRVLSLAKTAIATVAPLAKLSLRDLDISGTEFAEDDALGDLQTVRTLHIGTSKLMSLEPLRRLRNLRELRAGYLSSHLDVEPLLHVPPLSRLDLTPNSSFRKHWDALSARHHLVLWGE